ncbi:hypothetical protein COLO4_04490 [Corchorus olitorius]|uniref:Uncharacterized protein n=1 Tax=Corchorus olitorius TaxID=93759 RepID=A0A1R3KTN7_9ROSI|nr:hypothetical protein COLO4_04490 [Corchorus olitorius]
MLATAHFSLLPLLLALGDRVDQPSGLALNFALAPTSSLADSLNAMKLSRTTEESAPPKERAGGVVHRILPTNGPVLTTYYRDGHLLSIIGSYHMSYVDSSAFPLGLWKPEALYSAPEFIAWPGEYSNKAVASLSTDLFLHLTYDDSDDRNWDLDR